MEHNVVVDAGINEDPHGVNILSSCVSIKPAANAVACVPVLAPTAVDTILFSIVATVEAENIKGLVPPEVKLKEAGLKSNLPVASFVTEN